jgi:hypothetical protein
MRLRIFFQQNSRHAPVGDHSPHLRCQILGVTGKVIDASPWGQKLSPV